MRPNMTKTLKNTELHVFFLQILFKFAGDFINENKENVQQLMNSFSNKIVWYDKCSFVKKKCHNDPKIVKKLSKKFSKLSTF